MIGGVFYVAFPLSQYNEDVREIAKERGLTIVDAKHQGVNLQMQNPPKLTLKESKPSSKK
jgi:hypothetical protein